MSEKPDGFLLFGQSGHSERAFDGGLAFPGRVMVPDYVDPDTGQTLTWRGEERNGMSLRDYAAIHALARIPYDPRTPHAKQAAEAYRMANAMMEERAKWDLIQEARK